MTTTEPETPLDALSTHTGRPVSRARPVTERRGSRTWDATLAGGIRVALKANTPGRQPERRDKIAELAREAKVLEALAQARAVEPGYLLAAGRWREGRWLAVRWISGTPLWTAFEPARTTGHRTPEHRELLLRTAASWAARLAALHVAGWTHADVQPTNTLIAPDGTAHLIDYALACGPDGGRDRAPYRGALTHTTAPETAAALLATDEDTHIQAGPPADIWGLGASLLWAWTGKRPVAYLADAPRRDKLTAIATGRTVDLATARPWPFPELEELINACLTPDPARRPPAHQLTRAVNTQV
ncbi:protein kinase domain-containing protein [Streptomyces aidingensis]|uniref:Protein kinase domain-containing protein n=1 Tax=Streptomyces aidingensis TaxID=910347 RepID=A0A1I1H2P1_9ACTN|nr:protein kinase [Streptomyces aidingensis]SFC18399.1 Protein kinase domain-containing protein [Streptomyces aidingensis]